MSPSKIPIIIIYECTIVFIWHYVINMAHLGYFQNLLLLQIMLQEIVLNLLMLSFIYEVRRNLISFIFVIFFSKTSFFPQNIYYLFLKLLIMY